MANWLDFKAIKRGVSLESLLRHYGIELRRSGPDQYRGRCPIHGGEGRDAFHVSWPGTSSTVSPAAPAGQCWTLWRRWKAAHCARRRRNSNLG